jgi:enoyl-CoA hydratase
VSDAVVTDPSLERDAVLTERRGAVLVITLNRPHAMNAITTGLGRGLQAAAEELDGDPALAVGVLTGAGRGFCAGMDLKVFGHAGPPEGIAEFIERGFRKPVIAAIESFAVAGGLEIALTCDLLIASRGAKLGIPEVTVGLFAGGGGLLRLPRRLPYSMAMEMALTGDPISAEQGFEHGLVSRLTEPGQALEVALSLADRIARNSPQGVLASKHLVQEMQGRSEREFWEYQAPILAEALASDEAREGAAAFAERRRPRWGAW